MLGLTHALFGLLLGSLAHLFFHTNPLPTLAFFLLGSLMPDIDYARSTLGKYFRVSWIMKHRGIMHSILGATVLTVIIQLIITFFKESNIYSLYFFFGYLSHLFLDALTKEGIQCFYPAKHVLKSKLKTGSLIEYILVLLIIILLYRIF